MSYFSFCRRALLWLLLLLASRESHAQFNVQLLKDIWPGANSSAPEDFILFHGKAYFAVKDNNINVHWSLWQSDGSPAGTQVFFSAPDSLQYIPQSLVQMGDTLFFITQITSPPYNQYILWQTTGDPTSLQPILTFPFFYGGLKAPVVLKDKIWLYSQGHVAFFYPALDSVLVFHEFNGNILQCNATKDHLYWFVLNPQNSYVTDFILYRSDGSTMEWVRKVGTAISGTNGSSICYTSLTRQFDHVLWTAQNVQYDGTGAGYAQGFSVGADGYQIVSSPGNNLQDAALTDHFFVVRSATMTTPLQPLADPAVTVMWPDSTWAALDPVPFENSRFAAAEEQVFALSPHALWASDGTAAGTHLVRSFAGTIKPVITHHNQLIFRHDTGTGTELWKSDGSPDSTMLVAVLTAGFSGEILNPFWLNGCTVLFSMIVPGKGRELCQLTLPPCAMPNTPTTEPLNNAGMSISPNPTTGNTSLWVEKLQDQPWLISISDLAGRPVWRCAQPTETTSTEIPSGSFPNGIYLVTMKSGNVQTVAKLVVQH